jgi:hypothetical protein
MTLRQIIAQTLLAISRGAEVYRVRGVVEVKTPHYRAYSAAGYVLGNDLPVPDSMTLVATRVYFATWQCY